MPGIRPFTLFWEIPDAVAKLEPLQQVCRQAIATYGDFLIVLEQQDYPVAAWKAAHHMTGNRLAHLVPRVLSAQEY